MDLSQLSPEQQRVVLAQMEAMGMRPPPHLQQQPGAPPRAAAARPWPPLSRPSRAAATAARLDAPAADWAGLKSFPAATQASLMALLADFQARGQTELTVLLLGKGGAGKSSTVNSLLGERAAPVAAFAASEPQRPLLVARSAAGFTLTLIDTPGLLEGDAVSARALAAARAAVDGRAVHALLWVDRLDIWRVEGQDRELFAAVTAAFGRSIWERAALTLTHGQLTPPDGVAYAAFAEGRSGALRAALRAAAGPGPALPLPLVLVENSGRCASNEAGEKVLPGGAVWLPAAYRALAALAAGPPYRYDPAAVRSADPNKAHAWAVLPLLALQALLVRAVLVPAMRADGEPGSRERKSRG